MGITHPISRFVKFYLWHRLYSLDFLLCLDYDKTCSNYRCKGYFGGTQMVTIGGLSKQTGCNIETIRYYERIGILSKPPRSEGGHRLYEREQIKRLVFIRRSRELGFSLDEIRTLLRMVDGKQFTCQEVKIVSDRHLENVKKKISDLRRLQKTLRGISSQCEGGLVPDCPIIDALFEEKR